MAEVDPSNPVARWMFPDDELTPHRVEMRRLADAGRLVIERMATTDAPHAVIERAAELIEAAARELEGHGHIRRYEGFAESANAGGSPSPHFDHSPVMGMANPIAPPSRIEAGGDRTIILHIRFGSAYEGPPGSVHGRGGGDVRRGAGDDPVAERRTGHDRHASVKYRRPTPLHRDLRFVGTPRAGGRRARSSPRAGASPATISPPRPRRCSSRRLRAHRDDGDADQPDS
jgi:hypothetical protein